MYLNKTPNLQRLIGIGIDVSFQYPMNMGMDMGMIFTNGYGFGYNSTYLEPPHCHPYLKLNVIKVSSE